MSKETMWIAFPNGGIIPAAVTGGKDRQVDAHEAVKVPADYGRHLVHDRFAYEAEAPGRKPKQAKTDDDASARLAELQSMKTAAASDEERSQIDAEIAALAEANPDLFAGG